MLRCQSTVFFVLIPFLVACTEPAPEIDSNHKASAKSAATDSSVVHPQQYSTIQNKQITIREGSKPYIKVEVIKPQAFAPTVQAPARIEFRSKALSTVGAVIAGRVGKINVQPGDRVKVGTIMASLESPEAAQMRADVARTKDELQRAEDHARRQEMMRSKGVGLEIERMEAEIQLKEARTEYARSVQSAELLGEGAGQAVSLNSPVDGVVLRVLTNLGAAVEAGAVLFELGEPNALRIVADVFENEIPLIFPGAKVKLQIESMRETLTGQVVSVSATIQPDLRRASVYIDLDKPEPGLKPGMFARATIQGNAPSRFVIPTNSVLIKDGKKTVVYLEVSDGVFEPRDVVVGQAREGLVPVLEGLKEGDRLVVSGALLLDSEAGMLL